MSDTTQQPPQQPAETPPPSQPHTRRVGTLTAGIALVLTGLAIGASLIWPSFDLALVFKLCPLILIFLGIEVLVSNFAADNVPVKYDFLSFFLCIILMFSALGLSMIPYFINYVGPEKDYAEERLSKELEEEVYLALEGNHDVYDTYCYVTLNNWSRPKDATLQNLTGGDSMSISIDLRGPYADAASFASACGTVRDELLDSGLKLDRLSFSWSTENENGDIDAYAHLDLSGNFALHETANELIQRVEFSPGEAAQPTPTQAPLPEATALPDAA